MQPRELRFLVVEDHDFQRNMIVQMLKGLHAKAVYAAEDGRVGLDILEHAQAQPDIIISDLDMPNMDGMEFIRHVGEVSRGTSLIVASAMERELLASVETMAAAYGITFLGTIEKPVTRGKLENLLKQHQPAPKRASGKPRPALLEFTADEILKGLHAGEFEPFYQAKVDMKTRVIAGAEALARWRHPRHGIVSPYAFVSAIETAGHVDVLTRCMLAKAAETAGMAREAGHEIRISVNVSLRSLADVTFAEQIACIVREHGAEPQWMVVEITESAATTSVGTALENLARLRMKGFGLAIDDYGTGYSSLAQLIRIPFTELKVDQSFVSQAARRESAMVILESSLEMARRLKLCAVAEGVETQENWDLLSRLGCDIAQGYYVSHPVDLAAFMEFLAAWPRMHAH